MTQAVVFLGPSLAARQARPLIDAVWLPPVRQGDVYRAVRRRRPLAIGIVDGFFHQVPSVWHREILWALAQGVHVFGAASMGALRAAELEPYGMRGVGRIFAAYRDGVFAPYPGNFEDDDEVAVVHGPAEAGYVAVSEALVDIRDDLARAASAGVIDEPTRDALAAIAKSLPYRERSAARVLAQASGQGIAVPGLASWLGEHRDSLKARDALAMLEAMARFVASRPAPFTPSFAFERASAWERFVAGAGAPDAMNEAERAALDELRLCPAKWRDAKRQAVLRLAALNLADGVTSDDRAAREALDRLRRDRGLMTRDALAAWLSAGGLDEAGLARLMRDEAALESLAAGSPAGLEQAVLDQLRLSGDFAPLAERGAAKRAWAARTGRDARAPAAIEDAALAAWFAERRAGHRFAQPDAAELAAACGFADTASFIYAVYLERLYSAEASAGGQDDPRLA